MPAIAASPRLYSINCSSQVTTRYSECRDPNYQRKSRFSLLRWTAVFFSCSIYMNSAAGRPVKDQGVAEASEIRRNRARVASRRCNPAFHMWLGRVKSIIELAPSDWLSNVTVQLFISRYSRYVVTKCERSKRPKAVGKMGVPGASTLKRRSRVRVEYLRNDTEQTYGCYRPVTESDMLPSELYHGQWPWSTL